MVNNKKLLIFLGGGGYKQVSKHLGGEGVYQFLIQPYMLEQVILGFLSCLCEQRAGLNREMAIYISRNWFLKVMSRGFFHKRRELKNTQNDFKKFNFEFKRVFFYQGLGKSRHFCWSSERAKNNTLKKKYDRSAFNCGGVAAGWGTNPLPPGIVWKLM